MHTLDKMHVSLGMSRFLGHPTAPLQLPHMHCGWLNQFIAFGCPRGHPHGASLAPGEKSVSLVGSCERELIYFAHVPPNVTMYIYIYMYYFFCIRLLWTWFDHQFSECCSWILRCPQCALGQVEHDKSKITMALWTTCFRINKSNKPPIGHAIAGIVHTYLYIKLFYKYDYILKPKQATLSTLYIR